MKKKIINIVLALAVAAAGLMATNITSFASTQTTGWDVSYDGNGLSSNYDVNKSTITSVMPGDTVVFEVNYKNDSSAAADFYLSTDIITSLEEKNADGSAASISGGAYSYTISYILDGATNTLYDSTTVGGDNTTVIGLKQVQGNLDSNQNTFFSVGRVTNGKAGTVVIEIKLDGNSQDNAYMQKLAELDVKFGVEAVSTAVAENVVTTTETKSVVYTIPGGTEVVVLEEPAIPLANNPITGDAVLPIFICGSMLILGLLLIVFYFWLSKKQREKVA